MNVRIIRIETGEILQEYDNAPAGIISGTFVGSPGPGTATYQVQIMATDPFGDDPPEGAFNISLVATVYKR